MARFYLEPGQCRGTLLRLADQEAHHALHVLRLRTGDKVTVLDGDGRQFVCEVAAHDRETLSLAVLEEHLAPAPLAKITLLQALPKGKAMESIVQKATELGVSRIVPLLSERVVTRLDQEDAGHKREKLQAVAIEAIKQCGSPWLPLVEAPVSPHDYLARKELFELALVASLQKGSRHPREYFESFFNRFGRLPKSIAIWIGPEGDFTSREIADIQRAGASPITLGPLVLRSETAALYCLSVLSYEMQIPSVSRDSPPA
jgi:16S rRNA (uracil1498-N3)-methyltransferase